MGDDKAVRGDALDRSREARCRAISEVAHDALLVMRAARFVECNDATLRLFGETRECCQRGTGRGLSIRVGLAREHGGELYQGAPLHMPPVAGHSPAGRFLGLRKLAVPPVWLLSSATKAARQLSTQLGPESVGVLLEGRAEGGCCFHLDLPCKATD